MDYRRVAVVIPYAELFALAYAVYLFAQRLIGNVVEVQTAYLVIAALARVRIQMSHCAQVGAYGGLVARIDHVLDLAAVYHGVHLRRARLKCAPRLNKPIVSGEPEIILKFSAP